MAVTLAEAARRLGRMHWVERRCFEVVGGWVAAVGCPEAKALFAAHCYHHAWHADVLADRFPSGYGHQLGDASAPGGTGLVDFFEALSAPASDAVLVARYARVLLPAKVAAYAFWRGQLSPVTDGSIDRWLAMIIADETADWQFAVTLADVMVTNRETLDEIAVQVVTSQSLLWVAGGLLGWEEQA